MEMEQIAESIVSISKRVAIRRISAKTKDLQLIQEEALKNRPLALKFVSQSNSSSSYSTTKEEDKDRKVR